MESHRKGDLTEAIVVVELKRRGISVSRPIGDNERYDLVAESDGGLWRLQVKTGWLTDGTIRFHGKSQHTNAQGNAYEPYDGDVDYFVVYVDELETMYLVEESAFQVDMRLRVDPSDQHDRSINWAEDYEFDRNWPPEQGTGERATGEDTIVDRLTEHGVTTYLPTGDVEACDAIAETSDGTVYRLRSELGWVVDGRIRFDSGDPSDQPVGQSSVDYVVVFCAELDQLYLVAREDFDSTMTLRVDEPDKPDSRINWAEDYEFDEQWPP